MNRLIIIIVLSTLQILAIQAQENDFSDSDRLDMLLPVDSRIDVVLDSDTYNEIDDQFAMIYAMLSRDRINLKAVFAAPYLNKRSNSPEDGMNKSYEEIIRICHIMKESPNEFAFEGSRSFMEDNKAPLESPAAKRLIELSRDYDKDRPLYVIAIGAITNIASAIKMDPDLISRIVLVWVGGNTKDWPRATEFNSAQDLNATQVIFDSGVPLVLIPAYPVTTHLSTTLAEMKQCLSEGGELSDYLLSIFEDYMSDRQEPGSSKVIWDISGIAWAINADWVPSKLQSTPIITDQHSYSYDPNRHLMRMAYYVNRDKIFTDLFSKIQKRN